MKLLSNKKENETIVLLGYSAIELRDFLKSLNEKWVDFEIDHKIPISWFESNTPANIVNDFRNLQLLSKGINTSKRNFYMDDVSDEFWFEAKQYVKKEFLK